MKKLFILISIFVFLFNNPTIFAQDNIIDSTKTSVKFWSYLEELHLELFQMEKGTIEHKKLALTMIDTLEAQLKIEPENPAILNNIISLNIWLKEYEVAYKTSLIIQNLYPDYFSVLQLQGIILELMGDTKKAREKYLEVINIISTEFLDKNLFEKSVLIELGVTYSFIHGKDKAHEYMVKIGKDYNIDKNLILEARIAINDFDKNKILDGL